MKKFKYHNSSQIYQYHISLPSFNEFTIIPSALQSELKRRCSREMIAHSKYSALSKKVLYAGALFIYLKGIVQLCTKLHLYPQRLHIGFTNNTRATLSFAFSILEDTLLHRIPMLI